MRDRRILVTGATGFVGGALVRRLLASGVDPSRLRLLVRDPRRAVLRGLPSASIVEGALENRDALQRAAFGVDLVFHVAGAVKALSRLEFHAANAGGTAALMGVLGDHAPGCRVVHVSSLAAAGPSLHGESSAQPPDRCAPRSHYGASKRAGELHVQASGDRLSWVVVRPPIVYGPDDAATELLFRQVRAPMIPVPWRPRPLSVIHVEDLVGALVLAAESSVTGCFLPVEGPDRVDSDLLVRTIAEACGRRARLIRVPVVALWPLALGCDVFARVFRHPTFLGCDKLRDLAAPGWVCDPTVAREAIGFVPEITSSRGLHEVAQAYR